MKNEYELCSKEDVLNKYKELELFFTSSLKEIDDLKSNNPSTRELLEKFKAKLKEIINECEEEIHIVENKIVWDKLVVAFFGVTNAGKSTIIETFRILFEKNKSESSDGLIVDANEDFTKDYHKYNLQINNKDFILVDMPGIEGNESEYKDCIKDALRQAHCVFYVNGNNKKPESLMAEKIKKYLGDWVEVYSIQNVRGSVVSITKSGEKLVDETTKAIGEQIEIVFKEKLGDKYKGNYQVQALLAMCSKGNFSADLECFNDEEKKKLVSFKKSQQTALNFFGTAENAFKFSNFNSIVEFVKNKSFDFQNEIIKSNKLKIDALKKRSKQKIKTAIDDEQQYIQSNKNQLSDFKTEINKIFNSSKNSYEIKTKQKKDNLLKKLKIDCIEIIEKWKNIDTKIKDKLTKFNIELQNNINQALNDEIRNMLVKINSRKNILEFKNVSFYDDINIAVNNLSSDVTNSIQLALKEVSAGVLEDIGETLSDALCNTVGNLLERDSLRVPTFSGGGLKGELISVALDFGVNILNSIFNRPSKKEKISYAVSELSKQIKEMDSRLDIKLNEVWIMFNEQISKTEKEFEKIFKREFENIDEFKLIIDTIISNIN